MKQKISLLLICLVFATLTVRAQNVREEFALDTMTISCLCPDGTMGHISGEGCLCGGIVITDYAVDTTQSIVTQNSGHMHTSDIGWFVGFGVVIGVILMYGFSVSKR